MTTSGFDAQNAFPPLGNQDYSDQSAAQFPSQMNGKANTFSGNLFLRCLLSNLRQGVIIIDANCKVLLWNHSIEDMTGVSCNQAVGIKAKPSLFNLADSDGNLIEEHNCPFARCVNTGQEMRSEYRIIGRSGREVKTELTMVPVVDEVNRVQGAVVLVYDESIQVDLKRQLRDLTAASTLDTLTRVANRAEFERVLDQYVKTHHSNHVPCSLIVCDIDFFKSINDNYGHHIGDQALTSVAQLLKQFVRNNDVVARYGGEEFVILCSDCDDSSAMERAEQIRHTLTQTPQTMLNGKCITASFGVSQLKTDDNATDFFVRADTALLKAKELGRNRVVEASSINNETLLKAPEQSSVTGVQWRRIGGRIITSQEFVTQTPREMLIRKIGGYIQEIEGEIVNVEHNHTVMKMTQVDPANAGRKGLFIVDIELHEVEKEDERDLSRTILRITFRAQKSGFFTKNAEDTHTFAMQDLRRYLMIQDHGSVLKVDAAATESGRD